MPLRFCEQLNAPSSQMAVTGGVPFPMHVAFAGMDDASHAGPFGPGCGVGGVGLGVGVGDGEGDDCRCIGMSAVMFPLTVTSRSAMSYPAFVARSVNLPVPSPLTQYWPELSLVVESEVSFTKTVAPPTGALPVSSLTVPQTLNVVGVGEGGVAGNAGTFSDLVATFAPTESV